MAGKEIRRLPNNVTPNRLVSKGYNLYYGNRGEQRHGHSVVVNGQVKYARTIGGKELR